MKRALYTIMTCFFLMIIKVSVYGQPRGVYGVPFGTFQGDKNITIVSFSEQWRSQEKLKQVYEELLQNFHGEELAYLSHIYIYPDSPEGVAGYYYEDFDIDENGKYVYKENRYIEIFDGDTYTDIKDIAPILAHEYGHHFTFYYLLTKENKYYPDWNQTEYARIRNLDQYPEVQYNNIYVEQYSHEWDVAEIAAEDYLQLFGSPLAKASRKYPDIALRLEQNIVEYEYSSASFNLLPQENLHIPLAADVKGLYLYWLTLAGYTAAEPQLASKPTLRLTEETEVMKGYITYKMEWDEIPVNKSYEYTLVMYKAGEPYFPKPLKTVYTGEEMEAYFGSVIRYNEDHTMDAILESYEGAYEFRLFIKDERGFMFSSEPYTHSFSYSYPSVFSPFEDVADDYWGSVYINDLYHQEIIGGYEDGTFRPENKITKAEFTTMLLRTMEALEYEPNPKSTYWFEQKGYFSMAKELGLLLEKDYGGDGKSFGLDEAVTREQMASIIARYIRIFEGDPREFHISFADEEQIQYVEEVRIAAGYGVIQGYPDTTFRPKVRATRAEAAKVVSKALEAIIGILNKKEIYIKNPAVRYYKDLNRI